MNQNRTSELIFPEVKIVEASAGSGKTYELAKRFIQLLMDSRLKEEQIPLRNILAITFTLKATREMRERIMEQLKKFALTAFVNSEEKQDLLNAVGLCEEEACKKAFSILDYIISHFNFFQVKNIDKFINVILSGCASELKLSANFKIKEDYSKYIAYSLDECIDIAADDEKIKEIFEQFLNQYLFLENRTGWFPKKDILDILNGMFSKNNIYGGDFEKFPVNNEELIILRQEVLKILRQIHDADPEGLNKTFLKTLRNFIGKNTHGFNIGDLAKKYFLADTLPMNKDFQASPEITRLWSNFRTHIVDLALKEALSWFNCYIDIFEEVHKIFREYAQKDDVVFMKELNKQLSVLFKETGISVPELYYRLANRFRHYLVDEFQDTNKLQWNNLLEMIKEALSTGGSLFYVGDKKQAIYRFRGGDVNLFDDIKAGFNQFNVNDKTKLRVNYRSHKEIVQFNNHIFSQQNVKNFLEAEQQKEKDDLKTLTEEQKQEILNVFSDSIQQDRYQKPHGYVKVDNIEYADKEEKDELIRIRLMKAMESLSSRKFPLKSIGILCRSNEEVELVTGWLSEEKINVASERTLNIMNNSLIQELIAFLKFLNSPIDDIAFSAFILGDIFTFATGLNRQKMSEFIFEFNRRGSKTTGSLYRAFRKQFTDVWEKFIAKFFRSVGFISLYELLVSILFKFSVFDNFGKFQGFFMHLLELAMKLEEENSDISFFLESINLIPENDLYVNFSDQNAVKVMTIHKAKGLGFPVVLVPFLENISAAQKKRSKAPYVVYEKQVNGKFGLLRLDKKYAIFSHRIRQAYIQEYVKSFIDELNLLYVTFTRAESELYIFMSYAQNKENNLALLLMPDGTTERGVQVKYREKGKGHEPRQLQISMPQYKDWVCALKEEFPSDTELCNRKNIKKGELLHAMLAQVNNLNDQKLSEVFKILRTIMEEQYLEVEDVDAYIAKIERIILSKDIKRFFFCGSSAKIYVEKEFVDKHGRAYRIDRLIVNDKEVLVIDFKSSSDGEERHVIQVKEYVQIVGDVYKNKKVRGYLLYMDEVKVVEV